MLATHCRVLADLLCPEDREKVPVSYNLIGLSVRLLHRFSFFLFFLRLLFCLSEESWDFDVVKIGEDVPTGADDV